MISKNNFVASTSKEQGMTDLKGSRVYVPQDRVFGTVVKHGGVLGIKDSYVVLEDGGRQKIFTGKSPDFVLADTKQKLCGTQMDVPDECILKCKKRLEDDKPRIRSTRKCYKSK